MLKTRCNGPRGKWGTPPISEAEHLVKVRDCLSTRLPTAKGEEIIALAKAPKGNVVIANSDAGWDPLTQVAIDEAFRAVGQLG